METFLGYLLNASAGIMLFYAVYWLFLRKETFHRANRFFLLAAMGASLFLPLFPVQYTLLAEPGTKETFRTISDTFKHIPVTQPTEYKEGNITWQNVVFIAYLTGAAIFLLRLLIQTIILFNLMIRHKVKSVNNIRIVENDKYGLPFSFLNVVFINPKFHTQEELPEILAHEKVHIRENHWFDLLFIELLTVIFWFNPFIWLFERSIKQNHEYLADKGVLAQGHTVARYQALLVNQLMGMQIIGITNNLNFALSTNRLKMMTKKKTSRVLGLKFMWALPVLALLLFAFAKPEYKLGNGEIQTQNDQILSNPALAQKTIKISGKVIDENKEPLPGTSVVVKGGTIGTVCDIDGKFNLEIPENAAIVLSFVGKETIEVSNAELISGNKVGDAFNRNYMMNDAVIEIYNSAVEGERLVPPPPPPPLKEPKGKEKTPPPPPPAKSGQSEEVFFIVEEMPTFPGGYEALQTYIADMQKKIAQGKGVKGKAKVAFTVSSKGKVSDIKVVEKDNDGTAKGAVVLASEMPDWTPGKQRGKAVPVKYLLPVEFK